MDERFDLIGDTSWFRFCFFAEYVKDEADAQRVLRRTPG